VTKGQYPYPADEFDDVDLDAGPRGVHRSPRSRWSRVWPFLLVLVLFPALAYGVVTYWTSDHGSTPTAAVTSPSASASGSAAATDPAAETPAETPASTAPASEPPAATADKATPVIVFNATSRKGIAASGAAVLTADGWTSVTPKNYTGGALKTSTVLYASADLEPTARAAAAALKITTVTLAKAGAVVGLEIVLEADYTP